MAKTVVNIDGFGQIMIRHPKKYDEDSVADVIAETVKKTMNLTQPRKQRARFHPALGIGGFVGDQAKAPSS